MNEAEYFRQAQDDADFRHTKILELREHRKTTGMFLIFGSTLLVGLTLYSGLAEGHWREGLTGTFPSVILMAWIHSNTKTRLAALEVMDGKAVERTARAREQNAS